MGPSKHPFQPIEIDEFRTWRIRRRISC